MTSPLLDPESISPQRFRYLALSVGELLDTQRDVLLLPGEAALPLEGAARALGAPGTHALNVVTSMYGAHFGNWMREGGAHVVDVAPPQGKAIDPEDVRRRLIEDPEISVVSFVHVEAISGVRNDARAISAIAHEHGALVVVDVVASVGAEEVLIDEWGIDIAIIGPQKAIAGPAGISIATVSEQAWTAMAENPGAPRGSLLSLLDWKEHWIDVERASIPVIVAPLEVLALEAAVDRVRREGLLQVLERHQRAALATRAAAASLGLSPFASEKDAAFIATTLRVPATLDARDVVQRAQLKGPVALSAGYGDLAADVIRVDHTGQRAQLDVVLQAMDALADALGTKYAAPERVSEALETARAAWSSRAR
jgi:aspartate aminotransferase-like enzyme